jgi:hypothetical protein
MSAVLLMKSWASAGKLLKVTNEGMRKILQMTKRTGD